MKTEVCLLRGPSDCGFNLPTAVNVDSWMRLKREEELWDEYRIRIEVKTIEDIDFSFLLGLIRVYLTIAK